MLITKQMQIEIVVTQIIDSLNSGVITLLGITVFVTVLLTFFVTRYTCKKMDTTKDALGIEKKLQTTVSNDSADKTLSQKEPAEVTAASTQSSLVSLVQGEEPKNETSPPQKGHKQPAIAIVFTIRKINKELPDSYCIKKVQERIRSFRIPFPTVGVQFQCPFDFSKIEGIALTDSKDIEAHKPELYLQALPTDMGLSLRCEDHILTLSGTPTKEYDGKLFFVYQTEEQKSIRRCLELEGKKYEEYRNYQEGIPFLISGSPRNSRKDIAVDWDKEGDYKMRIKKQGENC